MSDKQITVGEALVFYGSVDPTAGGGVAAEIGSLYLKDSGVLYQKTGAAATAWTLIGAPTNPAGLDTYVQYNDSGVFGGDSGFTYDKTTGKITVSKIDTTTVKAITSAGILFEANGGADILLLGAGGGQNATFYDGVKLDASTASRILSTDASKNITALDTATYPDLTQLSYLKGVTSAIQTQLDTKTGYCLQATAAALSPADSTTYYFGSTILAPTTSTGIRRIYIPKSGNIKAVRLFIANTGTLGTGESVAVNLRLNNTTDTLISNAVTTNTTANNFSNQSLSIAVAVGDYFEIKFAAPAYVTNPTNLQWNAVIYIEG